MNITKLDHVNIRTTQVDAMAKWYTEVLGLCIGPRPNFPFPGVWLYAGDTAVMHLVGVAGVPAIGSEADLKLEHFAFKATGAAAFKEKLRAMDMCYDVVDLAPIKQIQMHVWDPDGNHIHIDFVPDE